MCLPVVVAEIGRSGEEFLLSREVWCEVLSLETVSKVNVPADLLSLDVSVTNEDDACQLAVSHKLLALSEFLEESSSREVDPGTAQFL